MREIFAHDWGVIGEDRIRRWPSDIKEKRPIRVHISSFTQIGAIGAKHWNVTVQEQNNQWWSEEENAWVELSCDGERSGCSMRCAVLNKVDAGKMAVMFIELIAGKKRAHHTVSWDGPERPRWAR